MRFCLYPGLLCETGGRVCRWETADLYSDRIPERIPHNGDKIFETRDAVANGADEIDMVINIGFLKDKTV